MKTKLINRIITMMNFVSWCVLATCVNVQAEEIDYGSIYSEAVAQLEEKIQGSSWMSLDDFSYIFCDMDGDGYLEFLLQEPVQVHNAYMIYNYRWTKLYLLRGYWLFAVRI